MDLKKLILHPSRFGKEIEWRMTKKKFFSIKENARIGLNFSIIGPSNILIGANFLGGDNVSLWTWDESDRRSEYQKPRIIIGDNVTLTNGCMITCCRKITIGNGTLLGRGTIVTDNSHGKNNTIVELQCRPEIRTLYSKGEVNIGENVWTGANVCIMAGVSIGDGAIIGANSVVTHDIPSACLAVGAPAQVVKCLISEK